MNKINELLLQIAKRAERKDDDYLVKSFVQLGHVFTLLKCEDNQIIHGRRGTGKTHLLKYLKNKIQQKNEVVVEIDMRSLGSTGGIYADANININERATRLLSDTLCEIHQALLEEVSNNSNCDISKVIPYLDDFIDLSTNISIEGSVAIEEMVGESSENKQSNSFSLSTAPTIKVNLSASHKAAQSSTSKSTSSGREKLKLHFGAITKALKEITKLVPNKKIWILLDEWSELPLDLQPFIADALKKILFAIPNLIIKIASIEHRSRFRTTHNGLNIGLEISSDASTSINLDEFMVFDNDKVKAMNFFKELIHRHCIALDEEEVCSESSQKFITETFTQNSVFEEFVRASEGIPRDAIHIISNAAIHSEDKKLSIASIRQSARKWYTTNKSKDINANVEAVHLLDWIINRVIAEKHTRGFLVRSDTKEDLLEFLYDSRIIHLVKQGVSAKSHKGKRFNLYVLDYGCYADLLSTKDEPKGILFEEGEYIEIPKIDYRTINNSILDIQQYNSTGTLPLFNTTDDIYLHTKHNGNRLLLEKELDQDFLNVLPSNFNQLKIKETVYIPIIFSGLVIRSKLGHERSTGSEIAETFNQFLSDANTLKKANNISRALRDNEIVKAEKWLIIHPSGNTNVFSLSSDWKYHWDEYFKVDDLFQMS
ncbi:MAG TPA: hypothetical protein DEO86_02805 [Colwellia sp.]|nr:hypothetical protein [Colwellia sp.]